jgi:plastocyanin
MRLLKGLLTAAGLFLLTQNAWAKKDTVLMNDFVFVPANITITRGDTIVFKSNQVCCIAHTTTRTGLYSWDSGPMPLNATFLIPFHDAGKFDYECIPHAGIGMLGSVTVVSNVPSTDWLGLCLLLASLSAAAIWVLEKKRAIFFSR